MSGITITQRDDVRFIHLRYHDTANADGNAEKARVPTKAKGGLTIAYLVVDRLLDDEHRDVVYAAAKCHENDVFVKKIGRDKAAGRLKSKDIFLKYGGHLVLPMGTNLNDVTAAIIADVKKRWPIPENLF